MRSIRANIAPVRSSLSDLEGVGGLTVVRTCNFSFPAKILTPVDDILVPLFDEHALDDLLGRSGIAGVLTTPALAGSIPADLGLAVTRDPMLALHAVHSLLAGIPGRLWVDFESEIDPSADIRPGAYVAPKNVRIGRNAVVMAGAVVHERTSIGEKTRIHSSAVIGAEAYEIIYIDGCQTLRPQTGGVWIEDSCEVLSGTTITRAAFCGATTLESWSVLDCNVTVSHDTLIGSNVRIGGSSWIGGRVTIDDGAVLGPNCTVANGISIGQSARVSLGSVVTRNVEPLGHVSGNFAIPHKTFIENIKKSR